MMKSALMGKQQGMSLIGWLFVLAIFGFIGLFALRLAPLYFDYYTIKDVVEDVAGEVHNDNVSKIQLWKSLSKRLNVNYIDYITSDDLSVLRNKTGTHIVLEYKKMEHFLANIDLVVTFTCQSKVR
ncbi:MAG TPA: DUF4845 domain-containing protein [Gammaproteobacteria bacterium]|nr:DUF4845 domain-containing protein [Gammaproteobacteria bacterium]